MAPRPTKTTEHHRLISYSEVATALDCEAKWDFSYGDQLAGTSLAPKSVPVYFQAGRAWGAAAAALHTHYDQVDAGERAVTALLASLEGDAERQRKHGLYDAEFHAALTEKLLGILAHYVRTCPEVLMDPVTERELLVPIPSRTGKNASRRYRLLCYLDATSTDEGVWIEEFKLRDNLMAVEIIQLQRQIRWYSWAYRELTGVNVRGVFVNERLNEAPKPPRLVQARAKRKNEAPEDVPMRPSHATDQLCTAEAYVQVCAEYETEPNPETITALGARRWHQRVPIIFREGELDEAGQELVSAGHRIAELDSAKYLPLRNAKPQNCRGCRFREICPAPDDAALIDLFFERQAAKRDRGLDELLHR